MARNPSNMKGILEQPSPTNTQGSTLHVCERMYHGDPSESSRFSSYLGSIFVWTKDKACLEIFRLTTVRESFLCDRDAFGGKSIRSFQWRIPHATPSAKRIHTSELLSVD